jgi:hypothetical protein
LRSSIDTFTGIFRYLVFINGFRNPVAWCVVRCSPGYYCLINWIREICFNADIGHVTDDTHCVLGPRRIYEDRAHLFFECNFSMRIWNYLQISWRSNDNIQSVVEVAKQNFGQPFFMEVIISPLWNIWILRNGLIFRNERPTFGRWKSKFVHDMKWLQYRIKAKHKDKLLVWLATLP